MPRVICDPASCWRRTVIMAGLSAQTPENGDQCAAHVTDRRKEIVNGAVGMLEFRRGVHGNPARPGKISRPKRDFFRYLGPRLQARIHPSSQLPGVTVMSGKVAGALSSVAVPNDRLELDGRRASVMGNGQ